MVIGGDAGGMAAVSQVHKGRPDLDIVVLERGRWTSYSACGIPYVVGGDVDSIERLVARRPQDFRDRDGVDVRMRHEAMAIDLDARQVEVRAHELGRTFRLGFDDLLVATGGRSARPPLPGIDGPLVHGVQNLEDATHLLQHAETVGARRVTVVGGGYIGLEMAEAFVKRGATVTLVEGGPEVMGTLDPDMGALVRAALTRVGVDVRVGVSVTGFDPDRVITGADSIPTDLVVLGIGVAPNSELAGAAGLELGVRNAIVVDRRQRASVPGVWAAGDCCQSWHLVARRWVHLALGTVANKQSRVAGINIGGGYAAFPGVVGTAVSKICSTEVARTGLSESEAALVGFEVAAVTILSSTRAGYFPGAGPITVKMVAERGTGRLLGAQIVGVEGAAKRVDVLAVAVTAGMDVQQVLDLDLSYAPPFSPVWDPVLVAARELRKLV